jgi:hypothetical protein
MIPTQQNNPPADLFVYHPIHSIDTIIHVTALQSCGTLCCCYYIRQEASQDSSSLSFELHAEDGPPAATPTKSDR